jgi:apolipoprotein N-acyltransferase
MRINNLNKDRLMLIVSGILMGISFPPFPFPCQLLMFIGFVPYFLVLEKRERLIELNRASYLMGFFFSLITLYWVGSWQKEADTFLMISGGLLIFVEPVFFMIPTTLLYFSRNLFSRSKAIYIFPIFWITYEYLYMITDLSFPWLTLGSGLSPFNIFIQIADIAGALGISMIIIYINIFITKAIQAKSLSPKGFRINIALAASIIILVIGYGAFRLSTFKLSDKKVKVGLIQPNLDPWEKWSDTNLNELISNYLNLSRESVKEGAQVIFWPETALPVYLRDGGYNYLEDSINYFLYKNKISLITGMPDLLYYKPGANMPEDVKYSKPGNYYYATYNSVLLFSPFRQDIERYGKSKLVPFGERVPFVNELPFLRDFIKWSVGISDWNVGQDTTVFQVPLRNKDTLRSIVLFVMNRYILTTLRDL